MCDVCGGKFHNKNAISTHIRLKHLKVSKDQSIESEKLIACKYCGLSFNKKNTSRHLEVVHRMNKNIETDQRDVGSFDCRICYRPFLRQSSLRSHIEKVHGDNLETMAQVENCKVVWNCSDCDSIYLKKNELIKHCEKNHSKHPNEMDGLKRSLKSKNLICDTCGNISSNAFESSLHSLYYHADDDDDDDDVRNDNEIDCLGCDKKFIDGKSLKIHLITYHWFSSTNHDNECVFCYSTFDSNDSLRNHLSRAHELIYEKNILDENKINKIKKENNNNDNNGITNEGNAETEIQTEQFQNLFGCETCGEFFKSETDLSNHETKCPICHKCKICGKDYKTNNHLKRHVAEFHNTLSPIKCPLCPKIFPRKMNLHHHYKRRHLKQSKKFVCSYCGQSLKGIVALRSHEDRLHRNIRSYKCADCPEAFTTRGILRKHAQRHLTERPMLQCQFCEKKFSTISGIERHIKTHEGIKEFQCDTPLCGKSFYTKSELKRHIKFHTKDFKHVCPVCNHKFVSPGELKKHSTKHTGERPFKCHLCSCTYARRDDKVKHLKRVHNLKVKRVYGAPIPKPLGDNDDFVDTIVIDESCIENVS